MSKLSHKERLQTIFAGEKPDRFAASFWRHFFHMEHHAEGTAEAMLAFQKRFDWDFMKVNPRADYHVEDWGLKQEWSRDEFAKHKKSNFPITKAEDWEKITVLNPNKGVLAEHLDVISRIRKGSDKELPVLMTVFTPLAIAGRMVEDDQMLADHIRSHPDSVKKALEAITKTFVSFVGELRNAGADGLFYATTQWAASNLISWDEYQEFGVPYDLRVIQATESDAINLFHICSSNNFLTELADIDYQCQMYNWDSDDPTNLPLDKAYEPLNGKTLVGGADRNGWLLQSSPAEVGYMIDKIKDEHDPTRLIIGPGCSIPPETPMDNLQAIREKL